MNGVCTRWSVLYKHNDMPIDGCVYVHKAKAIKRMRGMSDPSQFVVGEVCIMPREVMDRILNALSSK